MEKDDHLGRTAGRNQIWFVELADFTVDHRDQRDRFPMRTLANRH
jgi:hypothetical protein